MTISSTVRISGPFTGNGVITTFPFTYKVFSKADVQVVRLTISTGVETTLTIVTDYNITLNGNQDSNPGGSIVLVTPLLALYTLTATSNIANLQPTDLTNQGGFYPEVITDALDRATIQIQQMSDDVTRSIKAPLSDDLTTMDMTIPVVADRINKLLAFGATGMPTAIAQPPSSITGNTNIVGTLGVTGATTLSSTLGVTGATTLASVDVTGASTLASVGVTGAATVGTTLSVTGNATFDTTTLFVDATNNRVGVATITPSRVLDVIGTFGATGAATLGSNLGVTGDLAVNTNKFTVTAATGNTLAAGTFTATNGVVAASLTSKIQPISASVASSALTVTLNPTILDFRSTTLGSGTITTVVVPATISIICPSTATLGTTSAVQSRIAVLAINNAGTAELALVNMSGGSELDETGLITTTAIAAASNSATLYYSTTARTSVAYRLVGYVESTQATAGTWATAPSTIQGVGGQAFSNTSSLGYGQTFQSVTRVSGTTYYNTTGKPIFVAIEFNAITTAPLLTIGGVTATLTAINTTENISFIVPSYMPYSFTAFAINDWYELR
jgi:hypothetical protein